MVVSSAPTSTTNITGFLIIVRGSSLRNESTTARKEWHYQRATCSSIERPRSIDISESLSCVHQQVFENWPETQGREERKSAHDQYRGD